MRTRLGIRTFRKTAVVLALFLSSRAVLKAAAETDWAVEHPEWGDCEKDADCVLVVPWCGTPPAINRRYRTEFDRWQSTRSMAYSDCLSNIDPLADPADPNSIGFAALCRAQRCVAVPARDLPDAWVRELPSSMNGGHLDLSGRGVTALGIHRLGRILNLSVLNLTGARITSLGLTSLKETRLDSLSLNRTGVTDEMVKGFASLQGLRYLDLGETRVTDMTLKELGKLAGLERLVLRKTMVTDAGMKELRGLQHLLVLDLAGTKVSDTGLKELSALTSLQVLLLTDTAVTDAGIRELRHLDGLTTLELTGTRTSTAAWERLLAPPLVEPSLWPPGAISALQPEQEGALELLHALKTASPDPSAMKGLPGTQRASEIYSLPGAKLRLLEKWEPDHKTAMLAIDVLVGTGDMHRFLEPICWTSLSDERGRDLLPGMRALLDSYGHRTRCGDFRWGGSAGFSGALGKREDLALTSIPLNATDPSTFIARAAGFVTVAFSLPQQTVAIPTSTQPGKVFPLPKGRELTWLGPVMWEGRQVYKFEVLGPLPRNRMRLESYECDREPAAWWSGGIGTPLELRLWSREPATSSLTSSEYRESRWRCQYFVDDTYTRLCTQASACRTLNLRFSDDIAAFVFPFQFEKMENLRAPK